MEFPNLGGFVYEDNQLEFVQTAEGRAVPNGASFDYEYYLKDHLGNTRVAFNEAGEVMQETHYYPFGLRLKGGSWQESGASRNKYLYNGKELEGEGLGLRWYHYGARFYDPQLGRWHSVDPADELNSPYNYSGNNPVRFVDPDGSEIIDSLTGEKISPQMAFERTMDIIKEHLLKGVKSSAKINFQGQNHASDILNVKWYNLPLVLFGINPGGNYDPRVLDVGESIKVILWSTHRGGRNKMFEIKGQKPTFLNTIVVKTSFANMKLESYDGNLRVLGRLAGSNEIVFKTSIYESKGFEPAIDIIGTKEMINETLKDTPWQLNQTASDSYKMTKSEQE